MFDGRERAEGLAIPGPSSRTRTSVERPPGQGPTAYLPGLGKGPGRGGTTAAAGGRTAGAPWGQRRDRCVERTRRTHGEQCPGADGGRCRRVADGSRRTFALPGRRGGDGRISRRRRGARRRLRGGVDRGRRRPSGVASGWRDGRDLRPWCRAARRAHGGVAGAGERRSRSPGSNPQEPVPEKRTRTWTRPGQWWWVSTGRAGRGWFWSTLCTTRPGAAPGCGWWRWCRCRSTGWRPTGWV